MLTYFSNIRTIRYGIISLILSLAVVLIPSPGMGGLAQAGGWRHGGHRGHGHGHGGGWVAPLIIGGVLGAAVTNSWASSPRTVFVEPYPRTVYMYPPVYLTQPPVYVTQPTISMAPSLPPAPVLPTPTAVIPPIVATAPGAIPDASPPVWYYCEQSKSYHPYVTECTSGWRAVQPSSPPPPPQ